MSVLSPFSETIRVESSNRSDAVDLARRLGHLHTYLVQLSDRRWHVCVRSDEVGEGEALLLRVRTTAEEWARDRRLESVLHAAGREFDLSG